MRRENEVPCTANDDIQLVAKVVSYRPLLRYDAILYESVRRTQRTPPPVVVLLRKYCNTHVRSRVGARASNVERATIKRNTFIHRIKVPR